MIEKIVGFLRNQDNPPSLDNLDFETTRLLKTQAISYEFEKIDYRDSSIQITAQFRDIKDYSAHIETNEEWQEKRAWYLKNAMTSLNLFLEGEAEGYLCEQEDWMFGGAIALEYYEPMLFQNNPELDCYSLERLVEIHKFAPKKETVKKATKKLREKTPKTFPERSLLAFQQLGYNVTLPSNVEENPWRTYELLKAIASRKLKTQKKYDRFMQNLSVCL